MGSAAVVQERKLQATRASDDVLGEVIEFRIDSFPSGFDKRGDALHLIPDNVLDPVKGIQFILVSTRPKVLVDEAEQGVEDFTCNTFDRDSLGHQTEVLEFVPLFR
jgi:hypothetical protein